ncbi:MAG: 2-C-methyl-D-erythritol 2,4-cyclodiphosphate synthase [Dehalococcoidales bacterium]|jgi:2-C-methyl-D-erythritol 2,4-cyclodiphosphate synthase|nr:2-C-methyl-D-erythritol 2,4-cyclodiphosphate synthase [Dehalococcoidales bacterium]
MAAKMRVGIGYDVHPFEPGGRLVLGGVEIPFDKGLSGWSDADVLSHAIIDALLGAAALGDIGSHFPSGDSEFKGISSLVLLKRVSERLATEGWLIDNVDATVVTEQPKLRDFIDPVRELLSQTLGITIGQVSVKASTANQVGSMGRGEGVAALAVALIRGDDN